VKVYFVTWWPDGRSRTKGFADDRSTSDFLSSLHQEAVVRDYRGRKIGAVVENPTGRPKWIFNYAVQHPVQSPASHEQEDADEMPQVPIEQHPHRAPPRR
jgi:hypothetical protein